MNLTKAIALLVGFSLLRNLARILFGEFYYTNFGAAVFSIITFSLFIFIVKALFRKDDIRYFPIDFVSNTVIKSSILVTFSIFSIYAISAEFEKLLRLGGAEFFDRDFIFNLNDHQRNYFIGILFVAPIFEELFIRGLFLQSFIKKYNSHVSILLTVIIFTGLHIKSSDFINWDFLATDRVFIALDCAFMSWLMLRVKNIKLMILLHFLWNLLNYAFPILLSLVGLHLTDIKSFYVFSITILVISIVGLIRGLSQIRH